MSASNDDILSEVQGLTKQLKALLSDFERAVGILHRLEKSDKLRSEKKEDAARGRES